MSDEPTIYDLVEQDPQVQRDKDAAYDGYPSWWPRDPYSGRPIEPDEM